MSDKLENNNKNNDVSDTSIKDINTKKNDITSNTSNNEERKDARTFNRRGAQGGRDFRRKKGGFKQGLRSNIVTEVLVRRRVATTREGGPKRSFSVMSVCGDKNGSIGLGLGSASTSSAASIKSNNIARNNMVSIFQGEKITTLFHNFVFKKRGITLVITRAKSGQGLKCSPTIEKMCRVLGLTDLSVKTHGSRNNLNVAKLFVEALKQQISYKNLKEFKYGKSKIVSKKVENKVEA